MEQDVLVTMTPKFLVAMITVDMKSNASSEQQQLQQKPISEPSIDTLVQEAALSILKSFVEHDKLVDQLKHVSPYSCSFFLSSFLSPLLPLFIFLLVLPLNPYI